MVKVLAPAMSLEASGQIGGVMVFSRWKGRPYARALVKPHNPKTQGQTGIRAMLAWLATQWKNLSDPEQASWVDLAAATNVLPFNSYVAHNMRRWRENKGPTQEYPAAETATAVTITLSVTGGARCMDISVDPSAATIGWGIAIFRHTVTGLGKVYNRLIKIVAINGTDAVLWTDAPLDAGTYYYTAAFVTDSGILGAAAVEDSDVVT